MKLAAAVRSDLADWQKLNVVGFLLSGIGHKNPELVGLPYRDSDGTDFLPMLGLPLRVYTGDVQALQRCLSRAMERKLQVAAYTDQLFGTGNDQDNRAAVARYAAPDLELAGLAVVGDRRSVDKAFDKLSLHP